MGFINQQTSLEGPTLEGFERRVFTKKQMIFNLPERIPFLLVKIDGFFPIALLWLVLKSLSFKVNCRFLDMGLFGSRARPNSLVNHICSLSHRPHVLFDISNYFILYPTLVAYSN